MELNNEYVKCRVDILNNGKNIRIKGTVNDMQNFKSVVLMAANPVNMSASYSGSGLPFPCADIAFENTKNIYSVQRNGTIDVIFTYPNSYYTVANKKKVVSSIFFTFEHLNGHKQFVRFQLQDMYELRTLTNRECRQGPEFYSKKYDILPIDNAEIIMREYANIKSQYKVA